MIIFIFFWELHVVFTKLILFIFLFFAFASRFIFPVLFLFLSLTQFLCELQFILLLLLFCSTSQSLHIFFWNFYQSPSFDFFRHFSKRHNFLSRFRSCGPYWKANKTAKWNNLLPFYTNCSLFRSRLLWFELLLSPIAPTPSVSLYWMRWKAEREEVRKSETGLLVGKLEAMWVGKLENFRSRQNFLLIFFFSVPQIKT